MIRRSVIAGLATAPVALPAFAKTRFMPLFDGRSLAGWTPLGDANWAVRDGAICADKGAISFLVSSGSYRDFELIAELWVSGDANSGDLHPLHRPPPGHGGQRL
jgi:hypothetical protein